MKRKMLKQSLIIWLLALLCVTGSNALREISQFHTRNNRGIEDAEYRRLFYSPEMREDRDKWSDSCLSFLQKAEKDSIYFPIPLSKADCSLTVSYVDSWMADREYKGKSGHEGTDIMADVNERGLYPVISISDGVVTNLGWLEKGGYRIGITSPSGVYYYYAHLDSYANMKEGDEVQAGQMIGFMGDSGYGAEGTTGQFPVHLHLGIYFFENGKEISVNPYYLLRALQDKTLKYYYI